ncbi:glutamine--fructose-6-phosphate transaminase (isomerizing) [Polynucleobacter paneuropaeus]|jgi:glucosamine--fructose-6-phosphate aminotransferase (isomerizing)|uniref:Glutamine--fructose-6-phosphate aminotransferase [isomerizing] n=1 Tax=Polynucleobacter paneuropaeus TaxID=2527775 RepID=A0AAE3CHT1_9BURK|nr:glutamine--fructose-6-phosphate transaminase (isomerizing) [Polynucleobacter paneuropaeus]MBT8582575.1 glutamine--fructose-6-phosphate transaminase (isomerizing) [Polynucleobacter paneuropaeus]MBT8589211.1 glutamine--fructose-6-phosphate transaminase (isomerizing) [Polynucleobacter paneuropaeus]MBT8591418.1 glutamine--fructose-6-phosphate transaminase (isomerizing) [Polynucleobacter paneuropaeus]MBT8592560.1 glutamine--fructose-6-phosphate transaminase (isomerizing) [Polynucleobacter paneuro
MCGIVGAVSSKNIVEVLIEGLRRLEYRGYDSCGFAVINSANAKHPIERARTTARVAELAEQGKQFIGTLGIAHTRWATHGKPDTQNAHPHISNGLIAVVHNGIIENYEALRTELQSAGYVFSSETDTEVIAHLIHQAYVAEGQKDLGFAVRSVLPRLHGAYAVGVIAQDHPDVLIGARVGSPLVIALGDGENFLASDALALAGRAHSMVYLEEGDVAVIKASAIQILDQSGKEVKRASKPMPAQSEAVDLGPYQHYMQKEIFEQPRAIGDTLANITQFGPELFGAKPADWNAFDQILILACGTSYYSACVAKYWLEEIAGIPTQVEIASEYRYRKTVSLPNTLVIVVSQSGETADTLAALRHAKSLGHLFTLAICNVASSAMVRETDWHFLTKAGTEIGVASTKAFTTQLLALYILTLSIAKRAGKLDPDQEKKLLRELRHLPKALHSVLALEPQIIAWSEAFAKCENALFLGRGMHYPIALEGALKLKEISYIHAEAYPAGELKHGPLALVTDKMPVVTIAPKDELLEKLKSNMQEVKARGGMLYVFADHDTDIVNTDGIHVIRLPEHYGNLSPILHVVPLQLLAYHTACARGTDVDKPRNLAKSVTVE